MFLNIKLKIKINIFKNQMTSNSDQTQNEEKYLSYKDIYNSRKYLICLLPKPCREVLNVSLKKKIENRDMLYKVFSDSIQSQYSTSKTYILSIISITDEKWVHENYIYNIVFIAVPKDLIYKLENENIHTIKYYIGKSNNSTEFKILNEAPHLNMLSTGDSDGNYLPFSWLVNIS